jgi:hypothetical protein
MDIPFLGPLKISTNLHVGEELISIWASQSKVDSALVIYHPEDSVRKKLVTLVEKHHRLVVVQAVRKMNVPQFLRAICEAMHLSAARRAFDCFERIREKGGPFHITDAHLLRTDHLSVLIDFAEGYGHRVVLSSTHRDLVALIRDRRVDNGPHWSKFCFPNVAAM